MLRHIILYLILACFGPFSFATENSASDQFYFSLGSHTEFYNSVQNNDEGDMRKIDFAPTLGAGVYFKHQNGFGLSPELNWVLPQLIEESNIIINLVMLRGDLTYDPLEWLRLRLGTGIMWSNQHGRGGKVKMNNGNTQTNFYYPNENKSSYNNTLDLGVEFMYRSLSARLQTYTYSVFKEEQRQISYTILLSYYWGK